MPATSLMGRPTLLAIFCSSLATLHIPWEGTSPRAPVLLLDLGTAFVLDLFTAAKQGRILTPSYPSAHLLEPSLE